MDQITAIIIDDEAPSRLMVKQLIEAYAKTMIIVGETNNGDDAIRLISDLKPQLIFLDIEMPGKNGFEVLAALPYQPIVVFITAYDQFAIKAFKEHAIDYLIKPVDDDRFKLTMEKIRRFVPVLSLEKVSQLKELFTESKPKIGATAIPVSIGNKIKLIKLSDISYAKADNGYVDLVTKTNETFLTGRTLNELQDFLPPNFIRVQKSFIVNKEMIKEVNKYFNNRFTLVMDDKAGTKILSGKSYTAALRKVLLRIE